MSSDDWKTAWYEGVAETYDRLAVPNLFAQPARDLAALLKPPAEALVLDAGAGTGAGALAVLEAAGARSRVVAVDPSSGMLRLARKNGLLLLVGGPLPGLPFPGAVLDGVLASFVLSHIPSWLEALSDMVRVLRPGGRLAASAWGTALSEPRKLWQALAESFAGKESLSSGVRGALPAGEWFSFPGRLEDALRGAGLEALQAHRRQYAAGSVKPRAGEDAASGPV